MAASRLNFPEMKSSRVTRATVAAARNQAHNPESVAKALEELLSAMQPPLDALVKHGDRVLIKVNMGCSGARKPEDRFTTHPEWVEALIHSLQRLGARVSFGDDVARAGKHCDNIWKTTGMWDVARKTGASLIDFVSAGAREVQGGFLYPRKYLITKAYFEADVVINAANCRSHANIGMSGAIKNMFGCVVGTRKVLIHTLFPGDVERFGRTIADIHRVIPADVSFLDLTTVLEGHGVADKVRTVGLVLASTDPVALDTVAAQAIGYENLDIWPTYYGGKLGLGCNDLEQIRIRGLDWNTFAKQRLEHPRIISMSRPGIYGRLTTALNKTILRPSPVITPNKCTGCGDCAARCPVHCIAPQAGHVYKIDLRSCVDCGCCLKVCEEGAVNLEFVGLAKTIRGVVKGSVDPYGSAGLDPSPRSVARPATQSKSGQYTGS